MKTQIDDIDDTLYKNGGLNCGWKSGDHEDYMRIYTKYGQYRLTSLAFYNEILGLIPDMTVEKIDQHTQIYKTYLELTQNKKQLISEYKAQMKRIRN